MLLQALSASFGAAPNAAASAPLLAGLLQLCKLAGLLGLDRQCEAAVGALAARCAVFDPAPVGECGRSRGRAPAVALGACLAAA
jgi:hypothetical protein